MSAFSVKATITATDQSGPALKSVRRNIIALTEATKKLNKLQSSVATPKLAGGNGMAGGFKAAAASSNTFTRALMNQNNALSANTAKLRTAQRALLAYAGAAGKAAQVPRLQGPQQGGGPRRYRNSYYGQFPQNIPAVLAHRAAHGVVTGGRIAAQKGGEGIMEANTQRALTSLHNLPQELVDKINVESKAASKKWKMVSPAGMHEIGRGAIGNLSDVKEFPQVMDAMGKSIQALTLVYGDASKANESVRKYYRAADVSGYSSSGKELTMFLDAITRANIKAEKDVNPTILGNNFRRMGIARFGMDSQFIGDFVNLTDEAQASAGNIIKQLHRELTDSSVAKKDRAAQAASGLRDGNGNVVDSSLFQKNKFDWIEKYVIPKMKAAGVNLDKADEVGKSARKMGLKSGALEAVQWYAEKRDEIVRNRKARDKVDLSDKKIKKIPDESLKGAIEAVISQFKALADTLTADTQPKVSSFISMLATGMQKLSELSDQPGTGGLVKAGAGTGAAVLGAGALIVRHAYENPGMSANTVAMGFLTRAVALNTLAQSKGALGGVLPGKAPALAGGAGILKGLGLGGLIVGTAYVTYKGMGGGMDQKEADTMRRMAELNKKIQVLDNLIAGKEGRGESATSTIKKRDEAKAEYDGLIVALREHKAALEANTLKKAESEAKRKETQSQLDGAGIGNVPGNAFTSKQSFDPAEFKANLKFAGMSAYELSQKLKAGGDQAAGAVKGAGDTVASRISGAGDPLVAALNNIAAKINAAGAGIKQGGTGNAGKEAP